VTLVEESSSDLLVKGKSSYIYIILCMYMCLRLMLNNLICMLFSWTPSSMLLRLLVNVLGINLEALIMITML